MGTSKYSDDFKRDAVHQITVRGSNSLWYALGEGQLPIAYWWAGPR